MAGVRRQRTAQEKQRSSFKARQRAVELYAANTAVAEIERRTDVDRYLRLLLAEVDLAGGGNFARASFAVPDLSTYLLVLSGGGLALFLHGHSSQSTFTAFCTWVATEEGYVKAISGAGDWSEILRLTGQPCGHGIGDFLERAVRPSRLMG